MAGGGSSKGSSKGVRIVVAGDRGTEKSSSIVTAAADTFPTNVPHVLPATRLPDDMYPEIVPITIIDTSSRSPDGYSLFACSFDGTMAIFHFKVSELGHRLTESELDELKRNRYGDVRGQQANLAESPTQLLLEAASAKLTTSKRIITGVIQKTMPIKSYADAGIATKASESQTVGRQRNVGAAGDALNKMASSVQVASPM